MPRTRLACFRAPRVPISVRPLRRIELPAVMRLYEAALPGRWGWPVRSEEYWEWLVNRGACDRVYVVAEGANRPSWPCNWRRFAATCS